MPSKRGTLLPVQFISEMGLIMIEVVELEEFELELVVVSVVVVIMSSDTVTDDVFVKDELMFPDEPPEIIVPPAADAQTPCELYRYPAIHMHPVL